MTSLAKTLDAELGEPGVQIHCNHLIEVDALDSLGLRANNGVFEPQETVLCRQLINCGDRVLDIGANSGYYTLLFSDLVSPGGHVTAIEPDQENFLYLQCTLASQGAEGITSLHQVALGETTHKAHLFSSEENAGTHHLYASVCCSSNNSTEVKVITGDSLPFFSLDFIKIAIEGYEPVALRGLAATLKQSPRLKILCEFSPFLLWEAGFSPVDFLEYLRISGLRLIAQDKQAWRVGCFDEITLALKQILPVAVTAFINNLEHADDNPAIYQQAKTFLKQHGYNRPLSENILLVSPGAWQTVCNTLGIDQASATDTPTVSDSKTGWQCRWVSRHDQDALLALFKSVFGYSMQTSLWAWKYASQCKPGILAHADGKVVAHYGGMPRSFWLHGKKLAAVQISDVMVAPEVRGILTRRGPFVLTAETFLQSQTGINKPYRFAFGFPIGRAGCVGEKLGLYARVDSFFETVWTATPELRLPCWLKVTLLNLSDDSIVNALWQDMKHSLPDIMLPQKDADFFRWRYLEHPVKIYNIYLISWRWFNKAVGVVVLRDHGTEQGLELLDFLGQPNVFNVLLKAAQNIAGQTNRQRVFSWMTPRIISMLPSPASQTEITGIYIDPPALKEMADQLHERWWFLGGDTDFR
jgi:FkbM family methyltransferase